MYWTKKTTLTRCLAVMMLVGACWFAGEGLYLECKAKLAQYLLHQAWQKKLQGESNPRPWPWADTHPLAQIQFPELQKEFIVLSGGTGRNLAFAPAHLSGSVAPGDVGVSVIGGHRDTHFEVLPRLKKGHHLILQKPNGQHSIFKVVAIEIADIRNSEISLMSDVPTLALVSCYPFHALTAGGSQRYLVIAEEENQKWMAL